MSEDRQRPELQRRKGVKLRAEESGRKRKSRTQGVWQERQVQTDDKAWRPRSRSNGGGLARMWGVLSPPLKPTTWLAPRCGLEMIPAQEWRSPCLVPVCHLVEEGLPNEELPGTPMTRRQLRTGEVLRGHAHTRRTRHLAGEG